jgi:hypothetical protein
VRPRTSKCLAETSTRLATHYCLFCSLHIYIFSKSDQIFIPKSDDYNNMDVRMSECMYVFIYVLIDLNVNDYKLLEPNCLMFRIPNSE